MKQIQIRIGYRNQMNPDLRIDQEIRSMSVDPLFREAPVGEEGLTKGASHLDRILAQTLD